MNYRKQIFGIMNISVLLWFGSYYLAYSCIKYDYCSHEALATPFLLCLPALFLVSFILLFTRDSTYLAWRKFAMWAIPISAIILILAPAQDASHVLGPDLTKETASWGISILFLIISLGIIIRNSLKTT